jgi:hypothetical protein
MIRNAVFNALHRGVALASLTAASDKTFRAWLGVYPLDTNEPSTAAMLRRQAFAVLPNTRFIYRIRAFEVPIALLEAGTSIGEPEIVNKQDCFAFSDDDLVRQVERLGVSIEALELPYKSDYPI